MIISIHRCHNLSCSIRCNAVDGNSRVPLKSSHSSVLLPVAGSEFDEAIDVKPVEESDSVAIGNPEDRSNGLSTSKTFIKVSFDTLMVHH